MTKQEIKESLFEQGYVLKYITKLLSHFPSNEVTPAQFHQAIDEEAESGNLY